MLWRHIGPSSHYCSKHRWKSKVDSLSLEVPARIEIWQVVLFLLLSANSVFRKTMNVSRMIMAQMLKNSKFVEQNLKERFSLSGSTRRERSISVVSIPQQRLLEPRKQQRTLCLVEQSSGSSGKHWWVYLRWEELTVKIHHLQLPQYQTKWITSMIVLWLLKAIPEKVPVHPRK